MKKLLKLPLLALFLGLTALAFGQTNTVDLDALAADIDANPDATVELVTAAVQASPDQMDAIAERLIAEFPELTEEIIAGAIAGMPVLTDEEKEDRISAFVAKMVRFRPALAPQIALGARRATGPEMGEAINRAAADTLRSIALGGGQTSGGSVAPQDNNQTLRVIISPAQMP